MMTLIKLPSNEYFQMSIIAKISGLRGHSRVTTESTLSILAKASSFSSRSLAVFRSRSTGAFRFKFPFENYGGRRPSVYPLFSKRSNICSSHGTNERSRREREPLATVGKRHRWLRYQLLGMRNGETIEFPETKGAAGTRHGDLFHDRFNCLESPGWTEASCG